MTNFVRGVQTARRRRQAGCGVAAGERRRVVDDAAGGLRALLPGLALMKLDRYAEADHGAGRSGVAANRGAPAGGRRVPPGRGARSAEGLQGRGRDLRVAGDAKTGAAAGGVAATGSGRRSRRPADAIGRSAAARLLRLSDHAGIRSGRRRSSTGRTSTSTPHWRRRSWRAPKRCSRRAAGRTRATSYDKRAIRS